MNKAFLRVFGIGVMMIWSQGAMSQEPEEKNIVLENQCIRYVISSDGKNVHFVDKQTGKDFVVGGPSARVKKEGKYYEASSALYRDGILEIDFGPAGVQAKVGVTVKDRYFILRVQDVAGTGVEELEFCNIQLNWKGEAADSMAGCVLALNLRTKVDAMPGAMRELRASCVSRFGFAGAEAAVIGCPAGQLREVMKEVVSGAEGLPHSPNGGPWALDCPINQGSYLISPSGMTEKTADDWIALIKGLGFTQVDFHGGHTFRFGDCFPNPEMFPDGFAGLKQVIDKLHAAGISAGLHTYAMFMDKECPWVTPVPDPRLGKDATFTLAKDLASKDSIVAVVETTKDMSAITGFFERNSATLQIDSELITYKQVVKEQPYAFAECRRGAYGTAISDHAAGAKVHHLKECFGLFAPDGDSSLLAEVAAKTAEAYNTCGFDMIYLDALDGSDILGGGENFWHYSAKFTYEIVRRLERPALMEMSAMTHHLWFVRSRIGAWDHSRRGHKKFIDLHCQANREGAGMFLPSNLGWWALMTCSGPADGAPYPLKGWSGPQDETTFPDDIEYLCGKALGNDFSLSLIGIDAEQFKNDPYMRRLAGIILNYETLRRQNYFSQNVKDQLRQPGREFTLERNADGQWQLRQVRYDKHKVTAIDGTGNVWRVENPCGRQPMRMRIEALASAGPYDHSDSITLVDFAQANPWTERAQAEGVTAEYEASKEQVKDWPISGKLTAVNSLSTRKGTWARLTKNFDPPINLSRQPALGVWIYGDGKGEILNFQLKRPSHLAWGAGEHYVVIDFTGWRYFELVEPESVRHADYSWPYGGLYEIYREFVNTEQVETLSVWYNNLPAEGSVTCYLGPIRAIPLAQTKLVNPQMIINGSTCVFPVEMEMGSYLEYQSLSDCKLYDRKGKLIQDVACRGDAPELTAGANTVEFSGTSKNSVNPRANVTISVLGDAIGENKK
jgi:hypothetical protein